MKLYNNKYRVESSRLKEWDYSNPWWYYVTINTKNHVAVVRNNGFLDLYFNGVRAATRANVGNESYDSYTSHLTIGVLGDTSLYPLNGYVDELRIRKEAIYDADFTPPTAPFSY